MSKLQPDREPGMQAMLDLLPSIKTVPPILNLKEAEVLGANESGDQGKTGPIYKLLCKEGIMATFERNGNTFTLVEKMPLHR